MADPTICHPDYTFQVAKMIKNKDTGEITYEYRTDCTYPGCGKTTKSFANKDDAIAEWNNTVNKT